MVCRNAFEEGFVRLLAALVPPGTQVVVPADAGFGRTELFRTPQELALSYVMRLPLSTRTTTTSVRSALESR